MSSLYPHPKGCGIRLDALITIWLLAIRQIMSNLTNVWCFLAYAAGFATGTLVGMLIEERLSIGKVIVRIITRRDASSLLESLKGARFVVTSLGADGPEGKVQLIITVIHKKDIPKIVSLIKRFNPQSFYTIEDVRYSFDKNVPVRTYRRLINPFGLLRKGK